MPAPWIQIKLLKVLSLLGTNDQRASEGMYEVLYEVLRRAEASRGVPPRSVPEWVDEVEDAWASVGRA